MLDEILYGVSYERQMVEIEEYVARANGSGIYGLDEASESDSNY